VLPRGHARGRRGSALHRPADGRAGLRGHRQRRPPGAGGGDRGGGRGRAREDAGVSVRAGPGGDLSLAGTQVRCSQASARRLAGIHPRARRSTTASMDTVLDEKRRWLRQPTPPAQALLAAGVDARFGHRRALLRARRGRGGVAGAARGDPPRPRSRYLTTVKLRRRVEVPAVIVTVYIPGFSAVWRLMRPLKASWFLPA